MTSGQDCLFDLEQRKHHGVWARTHTHSHTHTPEPGVGISIAELLASGDRVLSVLPHDLVAKGWVQVQPWLFLETLLFFLYFA